jgi:biotin carboxyl carrier protein
MSENKINKEDFKSLHLWDADYKTTFTKKFENRKPYIAPDPKKVLSFIPGTIREILVKEGQVVKKGDPMFILESMKMMNIVRVPLDGKVKKTYVTIGEQIAKSHLLIEFE